MPIRFPTLMAGYRSDQHRRRQYRTVMPSPWHSRFLSSTNAGCTIILHASVEFTTDNERRRGMKRVRFPAALVALVIGSVMVAAANAEQVDDPIYKAWASY